MKDVQYSGELVEDGGFGHIVHGNEVFIIFVLELLIFGEGDGGWEVFVPVDEQHSDQHCGYFILHQFLLDVDIVDCIVLAVLP